MAQRVAFLWRCSSGHHMVIHACLCLRINMGEEIWGKRWHREVWKRVADKNTCNTQFHIRKHSRLSWLVRTAIWSWTCFVLWQHTTVDHRAVADAIATDIKNNSIFTGFQEVTNTVVAVVNIILLLYTQCFLGHTHKQETTIRLKLGLQS